VPQPITAAGIHAAERQRLHAFVTVLRYPSGRDPAFWAQLVTVYARYHHQLGFAVTIVYMRDNMLAAFVQQKAVQSAISAGLLTVVRWDDVAPVPDDAEQVYDQVRYQTSNCLMMRHPQAAGTSLMRKTLLTLLTTRLAGLSTGNLDVSMAGVLAQQWQQLCSTWWRSTHRWHTGAQTQWSFTRMWTSAWLSWTQLLATSRIWSWQGA
jgi:hypothetical protein